MRESNPEYFKKYYIEQTQQKGGHLPVFQGGRVQHGYGLGSILKGIYRWVVPHLKSVGQYALREGLGVAQDTLSGEKVGDSLKRRGGKALNDLANQNALQRQKGDGRKGLKRKRSTKNVSRTSTKKRKTSPPKGKDFKFFN